MNPNGTTIGRFFSPSRPSPPNVNEVAQIKQLQCVELEKEFGPQISEEVIMMVLDEAHDKGAQDPLEKARSWLAAMVDEQTVPLAGPSNDHGQPSTSFREPPRLETPPFQESNPWSFESSNQSWYGAVTGFAPGLDFERVPTRSNPTNGSEKPHSLYPVRSKNEGPCPMDEEDFCVVDQVDVKLQRLEKETEQFTTNAEATKRDNEKLREKYCELYSKCQDPMLTEYMNLVDSEEKLDKNIRSLQEILKSMGVSSENSDNVQSGQ